MTNFNAVETKSSDWENSWLIPRANSLEIQPKPIHWEITRCLIWLGRKIQARFGFRSSTYNALFKIRTIFLQQQATLSSDISIYQNNLELLNKKIAKHNNKQFFNQCKIEPINKVNIANGQFHTILNVEDLFNEGVFSSLSYLTFLYGSDIVKLFIINYL